MSRRTRAVASLACALTVAVWAAGARADTNGYAWSAVFVQQPPPTMHPGQITTLTVVVRNDGTETWSADGIIDAPVRLGTAAPRDRVSAFALQDPTWLWSGGTRIRMETPTVPPGALGSFTFSFRAPESPSYPRSYSEAFAPVREGGPWMDSSTIVLKTTVIPASGFVPPLPSPPPVPSPPPPPSPPPTPTPEPLPTPSSTPTPTWEEGYHWKLVGAQPAPAAMHPGQKVSLNVVAQNVGTETWQSEELSPTPMRLAAVNAPGVSPRERASAFGRDDPTWIWSGGRRIRMETPRVPTGGLAVFTFTFTAPRLNQYPQTFVERFAPVVEGIALLDDQPVSFVTQVRPLAGPLPPIEEVPPVPSPPPLPLPSETPSVLPSPLPTPSETPLPSPVPTPSVSPSVPPLPGSSCPSTAELRVDDVSSAAVAFGYSANGAILAGKIGAAQAAAFAFAKLFVADSANDRIAKTDPAGFATEYFGTPGSGAGQMRWPGGIAVTDSAIVLVADTGNDRIQSWGFAGVYLGAFGSRGSEPGQFRSPRGISVIRNGPLAGAVAVADTGNDRIQILSRTGEPLRVIGSAGSGAGEFSSPTAVAVWNETIFVADTGNERIQRLTLDGTPAGSWGGPGADAGCTAAPTAITADRFGVYVVESGSGRIEHFTRSGVLLETFGALAGPAAIAIDPTAKLFVTESATNRVVRFTPTVEAAPPSS